MKINFENLSVDAGNITVIDYDYLITNYGLMRIEEAISGGHSKVIEVEPGIYSISFNADCWIGKVFKVFNITTTGKLLVGDCCYLFDDQWQKFLDLTDYLHKNNNNFYSIDTGGDGGFDVELTVNKING
jgi:hypothetical protein